jgi:hypothetical protein
MTAKQRARTVLIAALLALASFGVGYKAAFDYQEQRRLECGALTYQLMGALNEALIRLEAQP